MRRLRRDRRPCARGCARCGAGRGGMSWAYEELPPKFNVAEVLLGARFNEPDAPAFLSKAERISYAELGREVGHVAGFFAANGIRPGDRIMLLLPNGFDFVLAFLGALWDGAIPVPVSTASTAELVRLILKDCEARMLVTTEQQSERLGAWVHSKVVVLADGERAFARACRDIAEPPACHAQGTSPALLLYTSGSTGQPKGVLHAQRSMLVCAELYAGALLGIRAGDVSYSVSPMSFAYGLGSMLYFPLASGSAAVLSQASNAFEIAADLMRYRPSLFWATPTTYAELLAVAERTVVDLSSVRLCVSAAETLSPLLWRRFRDHFGLEICEGLGTTEFLHIFVSNRPGEARPGTPGTAVLGYDIRVVDIEGRPLTTGQVGDIEVSGSSRMLGYWKSTPTGKATYPETTMRTGDRGSIDNDGYLRFLGRTDGLLKVNGLWVAPTQVEQTLATHSDVQSCAVVECLSERTARKCLVAFVIARPGCESEGLVRELTRLARMRLPNYMVPRVVRLVTELPHSTTGKVDRRALQELCPMNF